jgi:hypothetical protein
MTQREPREGTSKMGHSEDTHGHGAVTWHEVSWTGCWCWMDSRRKGVGLIRMVLRHFDTRIQAPLRGRR